MQVCFTAPVKFYSTYSELIPAPRGFDTTFNPLQSDKWQHFPKDFPSNLTLSLGKDKTCHVVVAWNGRTMETAKINLRDSARTIQFTARCPAISCKHIVVTESGMFVRRFQVSLKSKDDFERLQVILAGLRITVKPARSQVPAPDQSRLSSNYWGQPNVSVNVLSTTESNTLAANHSVPNAFCDNSPMDSQYVTGSIEQGFQYPLYSQLPSDIPWQTQSGSYFTKAVNPSETQNEAQILLPSQSLPLPNGTTNQTGPIRPIPSNPERPSNCGIQSTAQSIRVSPDKERKVIVELATEENLSTSESTVREDMAPAELFTKTKSCLSKENIELSQSCRDQICESRETRRAVTRSQEIAKEHLVNLKSVESNVLDNQGNIQSKEGTSEKGLKPLIIDKSKHNRKNDEKTCSQSPMIQPAATFQKIRISKRTIKEKLKDEYFMKWVSKVEEALSAMTDLQ
ncbi:hypothetical protein HG537_0A03250 [Torulaspora globosa]|uniref:Meiotic recombination protein REC114 n=1 Tax=Torulaspora globosa TaxID=48254 RepID=A0A7H9HJK8_9SACH|nr:hypothetical protein HG537_0A03250 [Torulaspora sp. CBS 2947]